MHYINWPALQCLEIAGFFGNKKKVCDACVNKFNFLSMLAGPETAVPVSWRDKLLRFGDLNLLLLN